MRRFGNQESSKHLPPVDVVLDDAPVFFIGPASEQNQTAQTPTRLMGKVLFHDPKIKWSRITLQLIGRATIDMHVPAKSLPKDVAGDLKPDDAMHLENTMPLCKVEKELIYTGEPAIEFGLHLPTHLPPSIKAKHTTVEYSLVASFSGGPFFKKYRIQRPVTVARYYLPKASILVPSVEYTGTHEWFEWVADIPKIVAIGPREVAVALRWQSAKEHVKVEFIEMAFEEVETYRFSSKSGIHNLPASVTRFPITVYHPPAESCSSDTHFVRTPIPVNTPAHRFPRVIRPHHFNPFLELTHRIRLIIHFSDPNLKPVSLEFPITVTECPPNTDNAEVDEEPIVEPAGEQSVGRNGLRRRHGGVRIEFDLPEYTPRDGS